MNLKKNSTNRLMKDVRVSIKEGLLKEKLYFRINQTIDKIDPRLEKYRVSSKSYKGEMLFSHILGFKGENFAIGSQTGDLRLYNKIGDKAKNHLPSFMGDKILDMD